MVNVGAKLCFPGLMVYPHQFKSMPATTTIGTICNLITADLKRWNEQIGPIQIYKDNLENFYANEETVAACPSDNGWILLTYRLL